MLQNHGPERCDAHDDNKLVRSRLPQKEEICNGTQFSLSIAVAHWKRAHARCKQHG